MTEDWEQVTPFLQDMQHCTDDDYFNPQEVSVKALFGFGAYFFQCSFCSFFHLQFFLIVALISKMLNIQLLWNFIETSNHSIDKCSNSMQSWRVEWGTHSKHKIEFKKKLIKHINSHH